MYGHSPCVSASYSKKQQQLTATSSRGQARLSSACLQVARPPASVGEDERRASNTAGASTPPSPMHSLLLSPFSLLPTSKASPRLIKSPINFPLPSATPESPPHSSPLLIPSHALSSFSAPSRTTPRPAYSVMLTPILRHRVCSSDIFLYESANPECAIA